MKISINIIMNKTSETFQGLNLPQLSNAYSQLSQILSNKSSQQKMPITTNSSPNHSMPKFIIHKQSLSNMCDSVKFSPNLSQMLSKRKNLNHPKLKPNQSSNQARRSNVYIHLNDLQIKEQSRSPRDHYIPLSLKKRNQQDSKQFVLSTSDKLNSKTTLLENYIKSRTKLGRYSRVDNIDKTDVLQLVDKKALKFEIQAVQARRMSYLLQQQQEPLPFAKIQQANKQRFQQAISEHFNKKEVIKKEVCEIDFIEEQIQGDEKTFKNKREYRVSLTNESKKDIKIEDVKYQPKELDTKQKDEYNERIRQEIIANINYGQSNIKNQKKLMQNKQFRMLVQEGKCKSGSHKKVEVNYRQIRQDLVNSLNFLKRLKLTPKIIMTTEVFSYKPFQKPGSHEFISACKQVDVYRIEELLKQNRFLVFDFDYIQLTGLHWSCKRGCYKIVEQLLLQGADVDAQDLVGRTPLYFAIENNHYQIARLLLEHFANPWSTANIQYNKLCEDKKSIMKMLNRARKLHILMRMTPPSYREELWKQQVHGGLKV